MQFCLCVWISSCTSSICWKDYSFSTQLPFLLNQLPVYVWVCFCTLSSVSLICLSNMISVTQCIDHYNVVSLEVRQCMFSYFVWSCFDSFYIICTSIWNFGNLPIGYFSKKPAGIWVEYYLGSVGQYGEHCHLELFSSKHHSIPPQMGLLSLSHVLKGFSVGAWASVRFIPVCFVVFMLMLMISFFSFLGIANV